MPRRTPGGETPGERNERERRARQDQANRELAAQRRKESHRKQQERVEQARRYREAQASRDRAASARGTGGRGAASPAPARFGQNEASVYEYLKRHPEARLPEVAFHAIYGGGTTAWEGLHWKTRKNAEAEAARVVTRLKAEGKIKVTGYTLSGKPKYAAVGDTPTADESGRPWYEKGRKGKVKDRGKDEPQQPGATDKGGGSLGVFGAPGSQGGDSGSSGGSPGGSLGVFGAPGEGADDSSDDDGPRDGKLW